MIINRILQLAPISLSQFLFRLMHSNIGIIYLVYTFCDLGHEFGFGHEDGFGVDLYGGDVYRVFTERRRVQLLVHVCVLQLLILFLY
jgi:hypothetical protein